MLPWLQPAAYYVFVAPLVQLVGYDHPLIERVTVLLQLVLLTLVLPKFARAAAGEEPEAWKRPLARWGFLSLAGLWFLPSMLMRHSSEAAATLFLALSLAFWHRIESDEQRPVGRLGFWAGLCAGLAFWCRFQVGLFIAGFWLMRAACPDRKELSLRRALFSFAAGVAAMMPLGIAADLWGYGELTFSPWNYFVQNIINDRAAEFGRSPWYWYLGEGALLTLNPLIWLWLGRAAIVTWQKPFYRALTVGLGVFLLTHFGIAHKESRFLLPAIAPTLLLLFAMLRSDTSGASRAGRWLCSLPYVRVVAALNIVALIGFSLFGLVRDRARVERALWELPPGSTVISATNVFGHFDDALSPLPTSDGMLMRTFLKPPNLRFVYVAEPDFARGCAAQPEALALLTSRHEPPDASAIDDARFPAVAEYPPAWLHVDTAWFRRMWRFKLLRCADLLPSVETLASPPADP